MSQNAGGPSRPPASLLVVSGLTALLVLTPIGLTIFRAGQTGLQQAGELLFRPLVGELLFNTVCLAVVSVLAAALVGTSIAWFVERTRLPGRRIWAILVVIPLAIPAFTTSFAWVSLSQNLQDFWGAALVVSCAYYPLLYLPVAASLRSMDPSLEEVARTLGCGPISCFFRLVAPQIRPAVLGGMLLVALNVLTEFGAFGLLRFRTFTTEIYAEYRASFDDPAASLLAGVLIVLCLICLFAELRIRGNVLFGRIGSGVKRRPALYDLGRAAWPIAGLFLLFTILTVGVPVGMTLYWLTQPGAASITPAEASPTLLLNATLSSMFFGVSGALVTLVLAVPIGFLTTRYRGRLINLIERTSYLTQGMPGIVVALAMVFLTVHYVRPLYQSRGLLILTYSIQFLCLAIVGVRAALSHAQPRLEDMARSLGASPSVVIRRVLLPLVGPGLGAAAAMVFVSIITELTATLLLAPIGVRTLATEIWADTSTLAFAGAAPYAALMMTLSFAATWLLARRFGKSRIGA